MDSKPVLIMLVVLLAGCTSTGDDPACTRGTCEAPTRSAAPDSEVPGPTDTNTAGVPDNGTTELTSLAKCRGIYATAQIPLETARAIVPAAFNPAGLTSTTATTGLSVMDCGRVSSSTAFDEFHRSYWAIIRVEPISPDWNCEGLNSWVLELGVEDPALWSSTFPALDLKTASFEIEETATTGPRGQAWSIRAPDFEFQATSTMRDESGGALKVSHCFWTGDGPFRQVLFNHEYDQDQLVLQPCAMTLSGASRIIDAFPPGSCTITPFRQFAADFILQDGKFEANEG